MKKAIAEITPIKSNPNLQLQGARKTFQKDGHWIEKPNKTAVLLCICGNRYLKTRPHQDSCLMCMSMIVK